MSSDYTEEEEDFIDACLKHITSRTAAIMIDAIGTIVYLANTGYGKNKAEAAFLDYYVMKHDRYGDGWEELAIPDTNLSYAYTLKTLFNGSAVHAYVLDDNSVIDKVKKLAAQLNSKSIGRLEVYDAKMTVDVDLKVKQQYTKDNPTTFMGADNTPMGMDAFFPTYSVADINAVMGGLLAPFRAAAAGKSKTTYADQLSQEQKAARGKYAVSEILKQLDKLTKNSKAYATKLKGWVDSKGAGIGILNDGSTKYILYIDGTGSKYKNNQLVKKGSWKPIFDPKAGWIISIS